MIQEAEDLPYRVEPMRLSDLDGVMEIELQSHPSPWPASAYRHELEQNNLSHYFVARPRGDVTPGMERPRGWLRNWFRQPAQEQKVIGYGGFWLMVGEAHISTIAVAPEWRGMGIGELLLITLIDEALKLEAELVTLEVRVSNETAQNLYEKYGFEYVGKRKRYYRNNNEDAHIMTVEDIHSSEYLTFLQQRWEQLRQRLTRSRHMDENARG